MKKEIELEEKKRLLLEMLIEIDDYCLENNIQYFLVGGTLLGAARHEGFIPWDDDIDIGMRRNDYERFVKYYSSKSGNIKVVDHRTCKNYIWPAAKAIDIRTELIENGHVDNAIGVFIDIFPFDNVFGQYEDAIKKQKKIEFWKKLLCMRTLSVDQERSFLKNLIVRLSRMLNLIPSRLIIEHISSLSCKDINKKCNYICNYAGAWGAREIANISDFENCIRLRFEAQKFSVPEGYDNYLRTVYGDYMVLPPEEKRVTHHGNIAYWKEGHDK